jgi:amino acid transporter
VLCAAQAYVVVSVLHTNIIIQYFETFFKHLSLLLRVAEAVDARVTSREAHVEVGGRARRQRLAVLPQGLHTVIIIIVIIITTTINIIIIGSSSSIVITVMVIIVMVMVIIIMITSS